MKLCVIFLGNNLLILIGLTNYDLKQFGWVTYGFNLILTRLKSLMVVQY